MEKVPVIAKKIHDGEIESRGQGRLAEAMVLHCAIESTHQKCDRICDRFPFISAGVEP
jgi:hypothetical protein